jgi:hypothetical protein
MTAYRIPGYDRPDFASPSAHVISSVCIVTDGHHDQVAIWNRGGLAGTITVKAGDGKTLLRWLMPEHVEVCHE